MGEYAKAVRKMEAVGLVLTADGIWAWLYPEPITRKAKLLLKWWKSNYDSQRY